LTRQFLSANFAIPMRKIPRSPNVTAPPRLLIVDDNRMGVLARKTVLEESGYKVTATREPKDALELLAGGKFDLVITDYKMPGKSGGELVQRIRKIHPALPIVLITGFADSLGLNEKNTGADLVIQKSSGEVSQMIRGVSTLLRRAELARKKPPASARPVGKALRAKA